MLCERQQRFWCQLIWGCMFGLNRFGTGNMNRMNSVFQLGLWKSFWRLRRAPGNAIDFAGLRKVHHFSKEPLAWGYGLMAQEISSPWPSLPKIFKICLGGCTSLHFCVVTQKRSGTQAYMQNQGTSVASNRTFWRIVLSWSDRLDIWWCDWTILEDETLHIAEGNQHERTDGRPSVHFAAHSPLSGSKPIEYHAPWQGANKGWKKGVFSWWKGYQGERLVVVRFAFAAVLLPLNKVEPRVMDVAKAREMGLASREQRGAWGKTGKTFGWLVHRFGFLKQQVATFCSWLLVVRFVGLSKWECSQLVGELKAPIPENFWRHLWGAHRSVASVRTSLLWLS